MFQIKVMKQILVDSGLGNILITGVDACFKNNPRIVESSQTGKQWSSNL